MKKRWVCLLVTVAMLLSLLLTSCTGDAPQNEPPDKETENNDTTEKTEEETKPPVTASAYSVKVVDHFGSGMEDVVVKIMKDGETLVMKATKADGTASFKLEKGNYGVELDFPDESLKSMYAYDVNALALTPEASDLTVTLYRTVSDTVRVQGYSHVQNETIPADAYKVEEGAYWLKDLNPSDRTYFLFRPTRTGIYRFSVVSDARFEFGYYGGNLNGSRDSLLPVENKAMTTEIRTSNLGDSEESTTPYLLGVMPKSESVSNCVLVIERVGDVPFSPVDVEWKTILPAKNDLKQINYLNWSFGNFTSLDLSASEVSVIYNDTDGFYHFGAADGPIVYIRMDSASGYLGEGGTLYDMAEMSHVGAFFYDEDGKFLYKEEYNRLIFDYTAICDPVNGACPLTKQLVYVIETLANARGWFDASSDSYLFAGKSVNPDMMPYFACGYYKTVTPNTSGSENNPIKLGAETNGSVLFEKGTPLYFKTTAAKLTFEVADAKGELKVFCNGKTYVAGKEGKIVFTVSEANTLLTIAVDASSTSDCVSAVIVELT